VVELAFAFTTNINPSVKSAKDQIYVLTIVLKITVKSAEGPLSANITNGKPVV
jgi:hypothetical protein